MAMINYGTLVKRNGNIINAGTMFMSESDMGVIPVTDAWDNNSKEHAIKDDYFAYVGDGDLMLCFYKHSIAFVRGDTYLGSLRIGQPQDSVCDTDYIRNCLFAEHLFNPFNCGIDIYFKYFSAEPIYEIEGELDFIENVDRISGYVVEQRSFWKIIKDAYGLSDIYCKRCRKIYKKMCKNIRRTKQLDKRYLFPRHYGNKVSSGRFYIIFDYKGNKYEVVTGYGIDWNIDFYTEENMNRYGYTEAEQKFMKDFLKTTSMH